LVYRCSPGHAVSEDNNTGGDLAASPSGGETYFIRKCAHNKLMNRMEFMGPCGCTRVKNFCPSMEVPHSREKRIPSLALGESFDISCDNGYILRDSENRNLELNEDVGEYTTTPNDNHDKKKPKKKLTVMCGESMLNPQMVYNNNLRLPLLTCWLEKQFKNPRPIISRMLQKAFPTSSDEHDCPAKIIPNGQNVEAQKSGFVYSMSGGKIPGDARMQCSPDHVLVGPRGARQEKIVCGGDPHKPNAWVVLPALSTVFKCIPDDRFCAPLGPIHLYGRLQAKHDDPIPCPGPNMHFVKTDGEAPAATCLRAKGGEAAKGKWMINGYCAVNEYACESMRVPFGPLLPHSAENATRDSTALPCDCGFEWKDYSHNNKLKMSSSLFTCKNGTFTGGPHCALREKYCPSLRIFNGPSLDAKSVLPEALWVYPGLYKTVKIGGHMVAPSASLEGNYTRFFSPFDGRIVYNSTDLLPTTVTDPYCVKHKFILPPSSSKKDKRWRFGIRTHSGYESVSSWAYDNYFDFKQLPLPAGARLQEAHFLTTPVACQPGFEPAEEEGKGLELVCESPKAPAARNLRWRNRMCDGKADRGVWMSLRKQKVEQLYVIETLTKVVETLKLHKIPYERNSDCEGDYIHISQEHPYPRGNWTIEHEDVYLPRATLQCRPRLNFCPPIALTAFTGRGKKKTRAQKRGEEDTHVVSSGRIGSKSAGDNHYLSMMEPAFIQCDPGFDNSTSVVRPHDYGLFCNANATTGAPEFQWCKQVPHIILGANCTLTQQFPGDEEIAIPQQYLCCKGLVAPSEYCGHQKPDYCPRKTLEEQPGLQTDIPNGSIGDQFEVTCRPGYMANPDVLIKKKHKKIGDDEEGDVYEDVPVAECQLGGWSLDLLQETTLLDKPFLSYCVEIPNYCKGIGLREHREYKLVSPVPDSAVHRSGSGGVTTRCMNGFETTRGAAAWSIHCLPEPVDSPLYLRKKHKPFGGRWVPEPWCRVKENYCPAMALSDNTVLRPGNYTTKQSFECKKGYELAHASSEGIIRVRRKGDDVRCLERYIEENRKYLGLVCAGQRVLGWLLSIKERCTDITDHLDPEGHCPGDPKMVTFCWTGSREFGKWVVGVNSQTSLMTTIDGSLSWVYASYKALVKFWDHYQKYIPFDAPKDLRKWNSTMKANYWPWMPSVTVDFGPGHEATGIYDLPHDFYSPDYSESHPTQPTAEPQYVKRGTKGASMVVLFQAPAESGLNWVISSKVPWYPGMKEELGKLPVASAAGDITRFPTTAIWPQFQVNAHKELTDKPVVIAEDVQGFQGDDKSTTFDCVRRRCEFPERSRTHFYDQGILRIEAPGSTTCRDKYDCHGPYDYIYWGEEIRYVCDGSRGYMANEKTMGYDICDDDGLEPIFFKETQDNNNGGMDDIKNGEFGSSRLGNFGRSNNLSLKNDHSTDTPVYTPCVKRSDFCPSTDVKVGSVKVAIVPEAALHESVAPVCGSQVKLDHLKKHGRGGAVSSSGKILVGGAYESDVTLKCVYDASKSEAEGSWELPANVTLATMCKPKENWCRYKDRQGAYGSIRLKHGTFPTNKIGVKLTELAEITCDKYHYWPSDQDTPFCDSYVEEHYSKLNFFGGWNMNGYDYYHKRNGILEVECSPLRCTHYHDPSAHLFGAHMVGPAWEHTKECTVLNSGPSCRAGTHACCKMEGQCDWLAGFRSIDLSREELLTTCSFDHLLDATSVYSSSSSLDVQVERCLDHHVATCNEDNNKASAGTWVWGTPKRVDRGPQCGLLVHLEVVDAMTLRPLNGTVQIGESGTNDDVTRYRQKASSSSSNSSLATAPPSSPHVVELNAGLALGLSLADEAMITITPSEHEKYGVSHRTFKRYRDCVTVKKYIRGYGRHEDVTTCRIRIALAIPDEHHKASTSEPLCSWTTAASSMRAILTWKEKPQDLDLWLECESCVHSVLREDITGPAYALTTNVQSSPPHFGDNIKVNDVINDNKLLRGLDNLWIWTHPWDVIGFAPKGEPSSAALPPDLWAKSQALARSQICPQVEIQEDDKKRVNINGLHKYLTPEALEEMRVHYAALSSASDDGIKAKMALREQVKENFTGCASISSTPLSNINPRNKWVTSDTPRLTDLDRFFTLKESESSRVWRNGEWAFTRGSWSKKNVWRKKLEDAGVTISPVPKPTDADAGGTIIFPKDDLGPAIWANETIDVQRSVSEIYLNTGARNGFGPETMTLANVPPGRYNLMVFKPSLRDQTTIGGDANIEAGNPELRLYVGHTQFVCRMRQDCPTTGTPASLWYVASLDVEVVPSNENENEGKKKGESYKVSLTDYTKKTCEEKCSTKPTQWVKQETMVTTFTTNAFTFTRIPIYERQFRPGAKTFAWVITSVPENTNLKPGDLVTLIGKKDLSLVSTQEQLQEIMLNLGGGKETKWTVLKADEGHIKACLATCGERGITPKKSLSYPTTRQKLFDERTPKDPRRGSHRRYFKSMLDKEVVDDNNYLSEVCTGVCHVEDDETQDTGACFTRPFGSY